jgi:hypothetical protein
MKPLGGQELYNLLGRPTILCIFLVHCTGSIYGRCYNTMLAGSKFFLMVERMLSSKNLSIHLYGDHDSSSKLSCVRCTVNALSGGSNDFLYYSIVY